MPAFEDIMAVCRPLIDMGAALHWLRPKKKSPIEAAWSSAPVPTEADLRSTYRAENNVGIRLGEPSKTPYGYLHLIDLDVRSAEHGATAWAKLLELVPEARSLPSVVSGSGGASRHLYFFSEKPLKSEKLAKSTGFSMVFDKDKARDVRKNHWEIVLYGTGSQAVLPPSIHPDTGLPYTWEREFDFPMLDLGFVPTVSTDFTEFSSELDDDDDLEAIVRQSPMDLDEAEIDRIVERLPADWVEDRDDWVKVGAALHHQYQGGQKGFDRWCDWSKESSKFDMKTQKSVWKSFKGNSNPVRMASLIAAASDALLKENLPAIQVESDPLLDLLGEPGAVLLRSPPPRREWDSLLDRTEEGHPKSCLLNAKIVTQYDPRSFDVIAFNEFKQTQVQIARPRRGAFDTESSGRKAMLQLEGPVWDNPDTVNGSEWTDSHDNTLRMMIEAPRSQGGYGFKVSDRDIRAAINIIAGEKSFHPVKNYLLACEWDGVARAAGLFVDFLGCDDTPYHRECAELILLGAVARIFEPGHKFDFVPILEGIQGKRKSAFISILGRGWFSELSGDFHNNQAMVEQILGSWIVEIPELQGFSRADTNVLKAWVSRTADKVRLPYERRARVFSRQCVFIGSTNDDAYLRDHTGGRRFWPIKTNLPREIDTDGLERVVDLIWAETVVHYFQMREQIKLKYLPLYLRSSEAQEEAKQLQDSRRVETVEDSLAGLIQRWLDEPIGAEFDDLDTNTPKVYRNYACVSQIWCEMQGHDLGRLNREDQTRIGSALARLNGWAKMGQAKTKRYGHQRVYRRVGGFYEMDL